MPLAGVDRVAPLLLSGPGSDPFNLVIEARSGNLHLPGLLQGIANSPDGQHEALPCRPPVSDAPRPTGQDLKQVLDEFGFMLMMKYIKTPHLNLAYEEAGNPQGKPIVLVHGWPDDMRCMRSYSRI